MTKWQISHHVNPSQATASWFIVAALALGFVLPGPASAQFAEPIHQVIQPVLMWAISASPQSTILCGAAYCTDSGNGTLDPRSFQHLAGDVTDKDFSWGSKVDDFTTNEEPLETSVGVPTSNPEPSGRTSVVPGTIAKSSATPLKPNHKSAISVEPDYLPSWITDQPVPYLRYGAAPAVVTLHFGHK